MSLMAKTYPDILKEREAILGTFEALFKIRGMGDLHGRVFGAILLSVDEMTQDEISEFTGYSVPAVSSALDELARVGLINKRRRQDSRKYYYSSRADLDEILRMVLKTVHDDYVAVVLGQLGMVKKINPKSRPDAGPARAYRKHPELRERAQGTGIVPEETAGSPAGGKDMITVNRYRCGYCGACVGACPQNALDLIETFIEIDENCNNCSICTRVCPMGALELVKDEE